jgi:hypothetical protein
MVKVTVAEYDPVLYLGSLVKAQETDAAFPARLEWASAPNEPTEVDAVVEEVCEPVQAVPGAATVQV